MATPSIRDQIQAALGTGYRIERELGGGMSRVFVATELTLGRQVVVKALPPDLSAEVPAERFRREVTVAARLQHPLVVPLLSAGEASGTLYYLMPLVEGESLRDRLQREPQLPIADALRIACDVAEALAYAHAHGVVHRDIKPENVLLSGGHAMVADFGIAKALDRGERLTGTGITVGTPHYMSPEQASGEQEVDGRSDLYSLGCMLYEMLAGEPPFTGPTVQAIIAKRFVQAPTPLRSVREVSVRVEQLVARTLARAPVDRFASAGDLVTALNELLLSTGRDGSDTTADPTRLLADFERPHRRRRRIIRWAVGLGLLAGALVAVNAAGLHDPRSLLARGVLHERDAILVADFMNRTSDSTLGPVVTMALSTDLSQSRVVSIAQPTVVQSTLQQMRRDPGSPLDEALARQVARRAGIKAVVAGEVGRAGSGYVLSARLIASDSGTVFAAVRETAADPSDLLRAIDRLSRALRRRAGESVRAMRATPRLEQVTTPSVEALSLYTQSYESGMPLDRMIRLLRTAIDLDSSFAMAYRALGVKYNVVGDRDGMRWSLERAYRHRDRLPAFERAMTEGTYYRLVTKDLAAAAGAYERAIALRPEDPRVWDNFNAILFVRGEWDQLYENTRRWNAVDPANFMSYVFLAYLQLRRGERQASEATMASFRRRFPSASDSLADFASYAWFYRADSLGSVIARMRDRRYAAWRAAYLELRGRYRDADRELRTTEQEAAAAGVSAQVAQGIVRGEFEIVRGQPGRALRLADSLLALAPRVEFWGGYSAYLPIATVYARAGRPDRGRAVVSTFLRTATPGDREVNAMDLHRALAFIALAEGRPMHAIREFISWRDAKSCFMCVGHPELGRAFELAGQPDSAIAVYERFLTPLHSTRMPAVAQLRSSLGDVWDGQALERLALLYEARGDRDKSRRAWAELAELWKDADPELRPRVARARAATQTP